MPPGHRLLYRALLYFPAGLPAPALLPFPAGLPAPFLSPAGLPALSLLLSPSLLSLFFPSLYPQHPSGFLQKFLLILL